jgi:hypothetical protein
VHRLCQFYDQLPNQNIQSGSTTFPKFGTLEKIAVSVKVRQLFKVYQADYFSKVNLSVSKCHGHFGKVSASTTPHIQSGSTTFPKFGTLEKIAVYVNAQQQV